MLRRLAPPLPYGRLSDVELPLYPWQRERYWIEAPRRRGRAVPVVIRGKAHPLLGEARGVSTQQSTHLWEAPASVGSGCRWLGDHRQRARRGRVLPGCGLPGDGALAAGVRGATGAGPLEVDRRSSCGEALAFAGDTARVRRAAGRRPRSEPGGFRDFQDRQSGAGRYRRYVLPGPCARGDAAPVGMTRRSLGGRG